MPSLYRADGSFVSSKYKETFAEVSKESSTIAGSATKTSNNIDNETLINFVLLYHLFGPEMAGQRVTADNVYDTILRLQIDKKTADQIYESTLRKIAIAYGKIVEDYMLINRNNLGRLTKPEDTIINDLVMDVIRMRNTFPSNLQGLLTDTMIREGTIKMVTNIVNSYNTFLNDSIAIRFLPNYRDLIKRIEESVDQAIALKVQSEQIIVQPTISLSPAAKIEKNLCINKTCINESQLNKLIKLIK